MQNLVGTNSRLALVAVALVAVFSMVCECKPDPVPEPVTEPGFSVTISDGIIPASGEEYERQPQIQVSINNGDDEGYYISYVIGDGDDALSGKTIRFLGKRGYTFKGQFDEYPLTRDRRYGTFPVHISVLDGDDSSVIGTWDGLMSVRGENVKFYPVSFSVGGQTVSDAISGDEPLSLSMGRKAYVSRSWKPGTTPVEVLSVEKVSGTGGIEASLSGLGNTGQDGYPGVIGDGASGEGTLTFPITATAPGDALYRFVFANGTQRDTVMQSFTVGEASFSLNFTGPDTWTSGFFGPLHISVDGVQSGEDDNAKYSLKFYLDGSPEPVCYNTGISLPVSGLMIDLGDAGAALGAGNHVLSVSVTDPAGKTAAADLPFTVPDFNLVAEAASRTVLFGHPLKVLVSGNSAGREVSLSFFPDEGPSPESISGIMLSSSPVAVTLWDECPLSGNAEGKRHTVVVRAALDSGETCEQAVSFSVTGGPIDGVSLLKDDGSAMTAYMNSFESGSGIFLSPVALSDIPGVEPYVRSGSGRLVSADPSVAMVGDGSWSSGWNVLFKGLGRTDLTLSVSDVDEHEYVYPVRVYGTASVPVSLREDHLKTLVTFGIPEGFGCENCSWKYSGSVEVVVTDGDSEMDEVAHVETDITASKVNISDLIPDMSSFCRDKGMKVTVNVYLVLTPQTSFGNYNYIEFVPETASAYSGNNVSFAVVVGRGSV